MKERGHMARLSHFVILGLILLPGLVWARGQSGKVLRVAESYDAGNSQTMNLLEGYLNINPVGIGGPLLAVIEGSALASGEDAGTYIDLGKSGTGEISIYVVRSGDTLSDIAEMFGVSVNTIVWANNMTSRTLKVGQELVILPITGVKHTVKSGDTLQSLAKKYKADLDDILSYNGLETGSKIVVGDVIIIPDGVISATQNAIVQSTSQIVVSSGYYTRPIRGGRKTQGIHGYNGVDLAAPTGTPIYASAKGTVIIARTSGYNGGYGLYVAIKHPNGTQTVYGHMSRVNVSVGQQVSQGEIIGAVGNTGRSTGPHVHFEIRGARNPF